MRVRTMFGLVFVFVLACGLNALAGQTTEPVLVFQPALDQIHDQVKIPVLLPYKLPAEIHESNIKSAQGLITDTGYIISLYYEKGCGNACFAAAFEGSSKMFRNLPNTHSVKLASGLTGMFRPVSCGGSCAPANLWLEQAGVVYQIQIKLSGAISYGEQKRILVETANSMVAVQNK